MSRKIKQCNKMKKIFFSIIFIFVITILAFAQQNYEDVVYLKNGSIIRGMIIEQIPNVSVKIQTEGRNVFIYKMDEIEKITKEEKLNNSNNDIKIDRNTPLTFSHWSIYQKDEKLSFYEINLILSNNHDLKESYNSGNVLCILGNVFIPVSFLPIIAGIFVPQGSLGQVLCFAGGGAVLLAGILIDINGHFKIKNAVKIYNSSLK